MDLPTIGDKLKRAFNTIGLEIDDEEGFILEEDLGSYLDVEGIIEIVYAASFTYKNYELRDGRIDAAKVTSRSKALIERILDTEIENDYEIVGQDNCIDNLITEAFEYLKEVEGSYGRFKLFRDRGDNLAINSL